MNWVLIMIYPRDNYFEFKVKKNQSIDVEKKRVISIEEIYPDNLDFPDANKDKARCYVTIQTTDDEIQNIKSIEKWKKLTNRFYGMLWTKMK